MSVDCEKNSVCFQETLLSPEKVHKRQDQGPEYQIVGAGNVLKQARKF